MEEEENSGEEQALEVFLRTRPHPTVKHGAAYRRVGSMERIHGRLRNPLKNENKEERTRTLTYSSQRSLKNTLIPSSFFVSCRTINFMSVVLKKTGSERETTTDCRR